MKSIAKAALRSLGLSQAGRKVYQSVVRAVQPSKMAALRLVSRSGMASTIYYALVSSAFRREHQAVLAGRVAYHDEHKSGASAAYLLRRNVHRIEKGLIMRPRRGIFATGYIGETAKTYERLAHSNGANGITNDLEWADGVLSTYFDATEDHPAIANARARFASRRVTTESPKLTPYRRDLTTPASVDFDDLHALSMRRRSVRWFKQEPVPRELIDKALSVAIQAPSACNRQPYKFRLYDEPERTRRIAAIPMGTSGFSDNIPTIAVLIGDQSAYFNERDRHVIYIDASLAAMSFLLALETLGLSTCCINWPDIGSKEKKIRAELDLELHERVIMLIAIGYPDEDGLVPYSQKRAIPEVRSFNN